MNSGMFVPHHEVAVLPAMAIVQRRIIQQVKQHLQHRSAFESRQTIDGGGVAGIDKQKWLTGHRMRGEYRMHHSGECLAGFRRLFGTEHPIDLEPEARSRIVHRI